MVRRRTVNAFYAGSSPASGATHSGVVQRVEHRPLKSGAQIDFCLMAKVGGSELCGNAQLRVLTISRSIEFYEKNI